MADGDGGEESASSNSDAYPPGMVVYTPNEIMKRGLYLIHYTARRIKRAKKAVNIERFKHHFGSEPVVIAAIFEELQLTEIPEAFLPPGDANLDYFLMAMHALKKYPKEMEREAIFDVDRQKGRDWVWYFLEKVQALKAVKIRWPESNEDVWVITVDGTHCWIEEPQHPEWSQDSRYYSHKYGKAGVDYELGIALPVSLLVWMNGPYPAGESDLRVFKRYGLKQKLTAENKRAIADGGYQGYPKLLSTPNSQDSKEVKKFKSRALKRHETFNGMTKRFECLSGCFRHGIDRFATMFEAICVICQFQLEHGHPLYDILVEGLDK